MCTVSIVPHATGFRAIVNRDERRTRGRAEPPAVHQTGGRAAIWPRDPDGGGTWVGVNDSGLACMLLNRTPPREGGVPAGAPSRGTIVPAVLGCDRLDLALTAAAARGPHRYAPFTLVACQAGTLAVIRNEPGTLDVHVCPLDRPCLFTSSSLGDDLVEAPRRRLFQRMVESTGDPLRGQAAFHQHRWKACPELSVQMSRSDARTVSRTVLDVVEGRIRLRYTAFEAEA